jgi:hypothetical protein
VAVDALGYSTCPRGVGAKYYHTAGRIPIPAVFARDGMKE